MAPAFSLKIPAINASADEAIRGKLTIFGDDGLTQLYLSLRDSQAFQRLQDIRFLGAIDYAFVHAPNGRPRFRRHSRFTHSLGVAHLALRYAELMSSPAAERRVLLATAMLHDLGHAPLSHSLEPLFWSRFGINHHLATLQILQGQVPMGREIGRILREAQVPDDRVTELLSGQSREFSNLFSGPINFDTLDGIMRSYSYVGAPFSPALTEFILDAAVLRNNERHRQIVDDFWAIKDAVYLTMIGSRRGVLADYASRQCIDQLSSLRPEDFYSTERALLNRTRSLRAVLLSPFMEVEVLRGAKSAVDYHRRRFLVFGTANFFGRDDASRYTQQKLPSSVTPTSLDDDETEEVCRKNFYGTLFDDDFSHRSSASFFRGPAESYARRN